MTDMEELLNIAELCPISEVLGPGRRFVFWVQGCPFNCKGCISPDWIPFKVANPTLVKDLANQILSTKDIDGISISGGEPFMQARQLVTLIDLIKSVNSKTNILVFTGFEIEQLVWPSAKELLNRIDVLIAGLYIDGLNDGKSLKGSSNQSIHFLTDRLLSSKNEILSARSKVELHIRNDGVLLAGIPQKEFKW